MAGAHVLLGLAEEGLIQGRVVGDDEHLAALAILLQRDRRGQCICPKGQLDARRPQAVKDHDGEARGQQLEHGDVKPPDVLGREGELPVEAVHVSAHARRLAIRGRVRGGVVDLRPRGGRDVRPPDDARDGGARRRAEEGEPSKQLRGHEGVRMDDGRRPLTPLSLWPVRSVEAVHEALGPAGRVPDVL